MILLANNQEQPVPRIICDHSLEDTVHWLRAAGYDVYLPVKRLSDQQLLELAIEDDRILIINKSNIKQIAASSNHVISISSSMIYEQLKEISSNLAIDWLYRPFSRCMVCNTELVKLNISQWIELPLKTQQQCVTSHGCPSCNRIYWAGDQINRMVGQLELFNKTSWK